MRIARSYSFLLPFFHVSSQPVVCEKLRKLNTFSSCSSFILYSSSFLISKFLVYFTRYHHHCLFGPSVLILDCLYTVTSLTFLYTFVFLVHFIYIICYLFSFSILFFISPLYRPSSFSASLRRFRRPIGSTRFSYYTLFYSFHFMFTRSIRMGICVIFISRSLTF
jgi:hypothetical protein